MFHRIPQLRAALREKGGRKERGRVGQEARLVLNFIRERSLAATGPLGPRKLDQEGIVFGRFLNEHLAGSFLK